MDQRAALADTPREIAILGVGCLAYPDDAAAVEHVKALVREGAKGYTVAINAEKIVRCQDDLQFREMVAGARVKVPDGAGAVLALRLLHGIRSAKVDFPRAALRAAEELGPQCRTAIIGATEESNAGAVAAIRRLYPHVEIVMNRSGFVSEDALLAELAVARPQLCLVAMGTPKQERFAARAATGGSVCLFVGCGGALDILSGAAVRAPPWMVRNYLEWLYRLAQQPSRWRRQTKLLLFVRMLLGAWLLGTPAGGRANPPSADK